MFKRTLIVSLSVAATGALLFAACTTNSSLADDAGKALAETACLPFDSSVATEDILTKYDEKLAEFGFDEDSLQEYLTSIEGTSELNEVSVVLRTHLQETCGDELEAYGTNAADLAETMVLE